jgi:hypothetical protein
MRQHLVQHTHLDPAIVAPLHRVVVAKLLRQVTPAPTRTRHPQQGIEEPPVIGARPALALAPARHKILDSLPLVIPQPVAIHADLPKVSVESDLRLLGNPNSLNRHHGLE